MSKIPSVRGVSLFDLENRMRTIRGYPRARTENGTGRKTIMSFQGGTPP
jgi:hypothetical protein